MERKRQETRNKQHLLFNNLDLMVFHENTSKSKKESLSLKGQLIYHRWRREDGMLCRSDNDCTWLNEKLECDDYQISWDMDSG